MHTHRLSNYVIFCPKFVKENQHLLWFRWLNKFKLHNLVLRKDYYDGILISWKLLKASSKADESRWHKRKSNRYAVACNFFLPHILTTIQNWDVITFEKRSDGLKKRLLWKIDCWGTLQRLMKVGDIKGKARDMLLHATTFHYRAVMWQTFELFCSVSQSIGY